MLAPFFCPVILLLAAVSVVGKLINALTALPDTEVHMVHMFNMNVSFNDTNCSGSYSIWVLTHVGTFFLGVFATLLIEWCGLLYFVHWLVYYTLPVKEKRSFVPPKSPKDTKGKQKLTRIAEDVPVDPQLHMAGWLRLSTRPLRPTELHEEDETQNGFKTVNKKKSFTAQASKYVASSASVGLQAARSVGEYLVARYLGHPATREVPPPLPPRPKPFRDVYAVLDYNFLRFYVDSTKSQLLETHALSKYDINLHPARGSDMEAFLRTNPLKFAPKDPSKDPFFVYCPTNSDKEDWYVYLCRGQSLPSYADYGAMSAYWQDSAQMMLYTKGWTKLIDKLSSTTDQSTAWLNAILGRLFVGARSHANFKRSILDKLSRHSLNYHRQESTDSPTFLGDIVFQDIDLGDSLPILSSPKLAPLSSATSTMEVRFDVSYDGGISIRAATLATLSATNIPLAPIQIPLVLNVGIRSFRATMICKMKSFCESNRIWTGLEPGSLKVQMNVEPVVWDNKISLQLVNQIIERRIKEAIEELVMCPNMEDMGFWESGGEGGLFSYDRKVNDEDESEEEYGASSDEGFDADTDSRSSVVEAARKGEAVESLVRRRVVRKRRTFEDLRREESSGSSAGNNPSDGETTEPSAITDAHTPWYLDTIGNTAETVGKLARQYGVDDTIRSVARTGADYGAPVLNTLENKFGQLTEIRNKVFGWFGAGKDEQTEAENSEEKDDGLSSSDDSDPTPKPQRRETTRPPSMIFEMMGVSLSTSPPTPNLSARTGTMSGTKEVEKITANIARDSSEDTMLEEMVWAEGCRPENGREE